MFYLMILLLIPLAIIAMIVFIVLLIVKSVRKPERIVSSSTISSGSLKEELAELKNRVSSLSNSLNSLELKINMLSTKEESVQPQPEEKAFVQEEEKQPEVSGYKPEVSAEEKETMEVNVGRFWLNRIGVVIFTLGIGFLISYSFRYFGAYLKIMFGYLISACLFYLGVKLENKQRYRNYGRVLLGGAWAIVYFTTYAMYHFDASRIINSQLLDLLLLALVAGGIIVHCLKYKSQQLLTLALFIGYITSTLGSVGQFTFYSCAILAVVCLVLVYKMQWTRIIFFGIMFTYLTHLLWVVKQIHLSPVAVGKFNVKDIYFLLNTGFLFFYWSMFVIGIHVIRISRDNRLFDRLSAANFSNFLLFFAMVFPKLSFLYPDQKFNFMFGLGIIYLIFAIITEKMNNRQLFVSNILAAVSLLTLAVPLRFSAYHSSLVWLVEAPFLLCLGVYFDRKVFRYLSMTLALFLFWKIVSFDFSRGYLTAASIFGYALNWNKFLTAIGLFSMAACVYIGKHSRLRPAYGVTETGFLNIFSALAVSFLTILLWQVLNFRWLTFGVSFEALFILACGILLKDKWLNAYAYILFLIAAYRFGVSDSYRYAGEFLKWGIISGELICFNCIYLLYRRLKKQSLASAIERFFSPSVFIVAALLLVYTIFTYITHFWISLGLGVAGVGLFIAGFLLKDKLYRLGGFVIFAITILRVVFADLAKLHVIYKIISFIVLGMLFLGVSFIYTKYNIGKSKD